MYLIVLHVNIRNLTRAHGNYVFQNIQLKEKTYSMLCNSLSNIHLFIHMYT